MYFFATTFFGIEDIAASELSGLIFSEPHADVSKVFFAGSVGDCVRLNFAAQTVNRIFLLLVRDKVTSLKEIEKAVAAVDYTEIIGRDQSFAVRAERVGTHDFTSIDMAAAVGKSVVETYKSATGVKLKVDLTSPDVELYAILRGDDFLLGVNTTGESLHKRFYRAGFHKAALSPTVANALVRLSGWCRGRTLLDPFCGSGTIPFEAAIYGLDICPGIRRKSHAFQKIMLFDDVVVEKVKEEMLRREKLDVVDVVGLDASPQALRIAKNSYEAFGRECGVNFVLGDALHLGKYIDRNVDEIVCNPPFGVRMRLAKPEKFYASAFRAMAEACPQASVTVLVNKPVKAYRAFESAAYAVLSFKKILLGDLSSYVMISIPMSV